MNNKPLIILLITIWILSGCSSKADLVAAPTQVLAQATSPANTTATPTNTPQLMAVCANSNCAAIRPTPEQAAPLRLSLPTPGDEPISGWRPPQYPVPLALGEFDHFYFARPIAADEVNWPVANYRYGGTGLGPGVTHTGVDIPAAAGSPVLAAGPGVVTWAGWGLFSGTPDNIKDPYGMAVSIRHDFGYLGQPLYTIYAHMQSINVAAGQWVNTGTKIGEVGDTGNTTGPHLHFEVRLGKDTYFNTRNPELWISPAQGWGVLAGRVLGPDQGPLHSMAVYIRSLDGNHEWIVNTYGPEAVNPDDYYAENMVISDLPAGRYEVKITYTDKLSDKIEVTVNPGRVTYFVYRATFGFTSTALPPAITPTVDATP